MGARHGHMVCRSPPIAGHMVSQDEESRSRLKAQDQDFCRINKQKRTRELATAPARRRGCGAPVIPVRLASNSWGAISVAIVQFPRMGLFLYVLHECCEWG